MSDTAINIASNDILFRKELPIIFEFFTNYNKDMINTDDTIQKHYIQWLEYQLYLYHADREVSDIIRYYKHVKKIAL